MIDRRHLSLLLLGAGAGLSGCAGGGSGASMMTADDVPEMLFISPMGEPFRAKPPAPYPVDVWFKGADKNADGKLDLDEFLADAERFFHVLDMTHDGIIDHREIYYYEHVMAPEVIGQAYGRLMGPGAPARLWRASNLQLAQLNPNSPGGMSGPPIVDAPPAGGGGGDVGSPYDKPLVGAASYNFLEDPEPVEGSDIRLTGAITLNDFKTRARQRFKLLDGDDKGYLTLAGLPQTRAQRQMPHPKGGRGATRRA
jgi:hypothetical protein